MAGSHDAFMGRLSGRIGNLVVYQMYGKTVVRVRPGYRSKQSSPELKASQNDFKAVVQVLSKLKDMLRFGFASQAINRSAWNAAVSINLNRYRQAADKPIANWLQLCAGGLPQANAWQTSLDENGQLLLHWENGPEASGHGADKLIVLLVPETDQFVQPVMEITTVKRVRQQAVLPLDGYAFTGPFDVFAAFIAAGYNGDRSPNGLSDSIWVGRIEP